MTLARNFGNLHFANLRQVTHAVEQAEAEASASTGTDDANTLGPPWPAGLYHSSDFGYSSYLQARSQ